jgi:P-type Cu2+ transporter
VRRTLARERTGAAKLACAHCGLDVPQALVRDGAPRQFCCAGCEQVHGLIQEWGYGQFYRYVGREGEPLEPARVSGREFEEFDDPALEAEFGDALERGRRRARLYLEGVHCAACVWLVEKLPEAVPGVDSVRLNLGSGVAEVVWDPGRVALSRIGRALDRLGYTPHVHRAGRVQEARRQEDRAALVKLGVATACAMNLMFLHGALYAGELSGMSSPFESYFRWVSFALSLPVVLFSARPFFQAAWAGLRARMVHIHLPVSIALAVAFSHGAWNTVRGSGPLYFDSLAMLVAALLAARQAQRSAQRHAIERADGLRGVAFIEFARRLAGEGTDAPAVEVDVHRLRPGDRVEVRSGELVPVDGVVLAGRSALDNAVLTGESTPCPVADGDAVCAGATNLGARLVVRVEAAGEKTRVGALYATVEEALASRPAVIQLSDRLARWFVSVLFALAAVTGLVWLPSGAALALERVVALLVIACPCAIGISVPLAVSVALMRAARAGIFVKNPDALQKLRRVSTVLLDKTGTLTEGRATLARWCGSDLALDLARALEEQSSHGVAQAFRAAPCGRLRPLRRVADVREAAGQGIAGAVDGRSVLVGSRAHVAAAGARVPAPLEAHGEALLADGLSPVYVALDGVVEGVAGVGDPPRADARRTIDELRRLGLRVRVVSGDHPRVVAQVAARLGIAAEDAHGGMTPEAKRGLVAALVAAPGRRGSVVMVGDGVNDAAALALADVGIVVLGGTGASIVAADVVLTREGTAPVLEVLHGARRVFGVIGRNLALSIAYNAVGATLALLGLVGPLLAAVLMPVSSLSVTLSSALSHTFGSPARSKERQAWS